MIADLHCHTTLSDGSLGIEDIIAQAKRTGVNYIAITDHDTVSSFSRAIVLGERYGVTVIPGVEFSAYDKQREKKVHILCYVPQKPDRLEGLCHKTNELRKARGKQMALKVMKEYPITLESVMKYASRSKAIFKAHIKHALMDYGYATAFHGGVFDDIFHPTDGLCSKEIAGEKDDYPEVHFVLELIHAANGIAIMAHPKAYDSFDLLEELCKSKKLDGVETWHYSADEETTNQIIQIADNYNIIKTGGSDFHGFYNFRPVSIGCNTTPVDSLERIIKNSSKDLKI